MDEKMKKILWGLLAVAMVVIGVIWFILDDTAPIEDTNGLANYDLQTITDEAMINRIMGMVG